LWLELRHQPLLPKTRPSFSASHLIFECGYWKVYLSCFPFSSDCRSRSSSISVADFDVLCAFQRHRLLLEHHPCC
jgi:hypothetical protein